MSKLTKLVGMSLDAWADKFIPMRNNIVCVASFDGLMFETYGAELEQVLAYANGKMGKTGSRKVWTLVEDDEGGAVIVEGYHLCNRLGYFITVKPAKVGIQYHVSLT